MQFGWPSLDTVEAALVECARLAQRRELWDELTKRHAEQLAAALRAIFDALALASAREVDAEFDPEVSGYVIRPVGSAKIRVPYHLVDVLLAGPALEELLTLAAAIRSHHDAIICLSGSSALAEIVDVVGDVDFCEYVAEDGRRHTLVDGIRHAEQLATDEVVCFAAHLFALHYEDTKRRNAVVDRASVKWPWTKPPSENHEMQRLLPRARKAKFDYLAHTQSEGLLVATDIVLLIGDDHDHTLLESHAGQEVPLGSAGSWVPRLFADPVEIGRYVTFLCDEVERLASDDPGKAAKRAIALARLLAHDRDADALADSLKERDVFVYAALRARLRIAIAVARLEDPERREQLVRRAVVTLQALCVRARDSNLHRMVTSIGKELDDLVGWIDDLEQYMQTKVVGDDAFGADLRVFVGRIREQIGSPPA